MNEAELIELFKPCEQLCKECGAICCHEADGKPCRALKDGRCTSRNEFCLMHYCDKIEKEFPDIVKKLKEEIAKMYPISIKMGITPNYKWEKKKGL